METLSIARLLNSENENLTICSKRGLVDVVPEKIPESLLADTLVSRLFSLHSSFSLQEVSALYSWEWVNFLHNNDAAHLNSFSCGKTFQATIESQKCFVHDDSYKSWTITHQRIRDDFGFCWWILRRGNKGYTQ